MPVKKVNIKPQWTYQGKTDFKVPENALGFTYRIDVLDSPFYYYYGKKNLTSTRGRGKKAVVSESNWRIYNSSSVELKSLIKSGKKYKKEIIDFADNKSELSLKELELIVCNNALRDRKSLNKWVSGKIFEKNLHDK